MAVLDAARIKKLHEDIASGDFQMVINLLEGNIAGQDLSLDGTSALNKAFSCEEYKIASHLIHKGAKINDDECDYLAVLDIGQTPINSFLLEYNKKSEKACIHYLLSLSQSPQGLEGDRYEAVNLMYEEFFRSEILKSLMNVLQSEVFDIIYDFESDYTNRVHRLSPEEIAVHGLTLTNTKDIFVGAECLLSDDLEKKAKVYGVVAEELCHLALTTLFENNANPYREENSELREDFWKIVSAVKTLTESSCSIEVVIKDVFTNYDHYDWDCELIARIPHVIGKYGEEKGKKIFQESSDLLELLSFYEENVLTKCREFAEPLPNPKSHRLMQQLMKTEEIISLEEKKIRPLKEDFGSFKDYLVEDRGVSLIATNCAKLCILQVYHELRGEYRDQLDRKCLFFTRKVFEENQDEIVKALRGSLLYEYVILMMDERELFVERFKAEYLNQFDEFMEKGLKIISILHSPFPDKKFIDKTLYYEWNDLSEEYKDLRTTAVMYFFNGVKEYAYIETENVEMDFSEDDILKIMNGHPFEVTCSDDLYSLGYNSATYVERLFRTWVLDGKTFQNLPSKTSFFITGIWRKNFEKVAVNKMLVQWVEEADDLILEEKSIFIVKDQTILTFEEFSKKNHQKTNIWIHYDGREFLLRSNSSDDALRRYFKPIRLTENEMLDELEEKGIVLISDNAGYGKSTAMSSIIRCLKEKDGQSLPIRVDLGKVSTKEISMESNRDEGMKENELLCLLGLKDGVKKYHFKRHSRYYFIFLDAFDEMNLKFKGKLMELILYLREKTFAKIVISTRKHLQEELEEKLNVNSYELVPFDQEERMRYLGMFWKWKLKYPKEDIMITSKEVKDAMSKKIKNIIVELKTEMTISDIEYYDVMYILENMNFKKSLSDLRSEIDKLDLTELAKRILDKNFLDRETLGFIGIPLHLFMIGTIHFGHNFNMKIQSDFHRLYSDFIEHKILIYLDEKLELKDGYMKDEISEKVTEDVYKMHTKIVDKLMDDGRVCLNSELDEKEKKLCSAIGIVYIHGGEVRFIHQTFAEFFKAESIRKNLEKGIFFQILFESKHKVVRRFLSSALKKNDFENLTTELFKDEEFLVNIVNRVNEKFYKWDSNLDKICILKIIKRLLENLESMVTGEKLVENFIRHLEERIKNGQIAFGSFLSNKMVKNLMWRNFDTNSIIILSFLLFSDSIEDVKDIMEECISIVNKIQFQSSSIKKENIGYESRDPITETYLKLLRLKDSDGFGLFKYAAKNEKKGVLTFVLNFFKQYSQKEGLSKLQALKEEIKETLLSSGIYGDTVIHLLFEKYSSKSLIQTLELIKDVLDDSNILKHLLMNQDVFSRNIFHLACYRNEILEDLLRFCGTHLEKDEVKDMLFSTDEDGDCVIHLLAKHSSSEILIQNLKIFKDVLVHEDLFKQFLRSTNTFSRSIFHLASCRNENLKGLLIYCKDHLEKYEIKEMLIRSDIFGVNVINFLVRNYTSELIIQSFELFNDVLGDSELFKELLMYKDEFSMNIFHLASYENENLKELLTFCSAHLHRDEIREMLLSSDEDGDKVIHFLVRNYSPELLIENLEFIEDILGDSELFNQFLMSEGEHSRNIFHVASYRQMNLSELLKFCANHIQKGKIKEMFLRSDETGNNVINFLNSSDSIETSKNNIEYIKDFLVEDEQQLLNSNGPPPKKMKLFL